MTISPDEIAFSDLDLKEVFGLFSSVSVYEREQLYAPNGSRDFRTIELADEYELTLEKREFALDALRSVLALLDRHGFRLEKDGKLVALTAIDSHFAG